MPSRDLSADNELGIAQLPVLGQEDCTVSEKVSYRTDMQWRPGRYLIDS